MYTLAAITLVLLLLVGWTLTLFSLPGNWLMVAAAAVYAYLIPPDHRVAIGWSVVAAMLLMAVAAEVIEAAAGALGTHRLGGSRRAMVLAVLGSFVGAIVGAAVGLPVPIVGPVIGVVLFACVGATLGAMLGEQWKGRSLADSWSVGVAAFWGRLWGTMAKLLLATAMVVLAVVAAVV